MTREEFLKQKKEFEESSIIAFEELINLAKEDDMMSRIVICSFYGIIANMRNFTKSEVNTMETLLIALQNGMYQMANKLNNMIEEYKVQESK